MIFIFLLVFESLIVIINYRKRDNVYVYIQMKLNIIIKLIEDGIENGNKIVFVQLKKDLVVIFKLFKIKLRCNVNVNKNKLYKILNY